ncbi:hypothetical protein MVEN_01824700 [Mycena venus]|uniref:DUF6534 domain-containing protein n=1 Tax=Mycena venus TaxID=2733690 RepID=A0A8H6XKX0_9AGAR|nr:hypothetical protein MVEN_01824700 [Mycena venus]
MSSGRLTGEDLRLCMAWLGPWLVGGCLDMFLQGILAAQFLNYFSFYRDDNLTLKIVVGVLALLNTLKTIHSFAIVWIQNIVYFGDLNGAILLNYTTWWQSGNPLIVALCGFYVQMYFCYRLWVISKKWYVAAPVTIIFLFAFLSMCVATYFITVVNLVQISNWFAAHLSSVFAGDVIMSSTTAYFLIKSKHDVLPQTVGLINSLVRLTFQTAAPAAICALFNLAFSQKNPGGSGIISTAFNLMLPKLYAISMMYTLNARRTIRASHGGVTTTSNEISGARSRGTRRQAGDIELGAIQVVTQTETHVDWEPAGGNGVDVKRDPYTSSRKSDADELEQYK